MPHAHAYIFFGIQGAGKGTQAQLLSNKLGIPQISTGDILRDAIARQTDAGKRVQSFLERGELVPDDLIFPVFTARFAEPDTQAGFILDGFPRTVVQAEGLDKLLAAQDSQITKAIHIRLEEDVLLDRLAHRWICRSCNAIYNQLTSPPREPGKCDACSGELYQRTDDQDVAAIKERIASFHTLTDEVIRYYADQGVLVEVEGNQSIEAVFSAILAELGLV